MRTDTRLWKGGADGSGKRRRTWGFRHGADGAFGNYGCAAVHMGPAPAKGVHEAVSGSVAARTLLISSTPPSVPFRSVAGAWALPSTARRSTPLSEASPCAGLPPPGRRACRENACFAWAASPTGALAGTAAPGPVRRGQRSFFRQFVCRFLQQVVHPVNVPLWRSAEARLSLPHPGGLGRYALPRPRPCFPEMPISNA